MKKSIIYTSVLAVAATSLTAGLVAMNQNAAAETVDVMEPVEAVAATLTKATGISTSKDETVYLISDASGSVNKTFIGNTLYTGSENLPFSLSIRYYLDGSEVSASEIAGKSGHVKIVFNYAATRFYQGKRVPFLAVSGMTLDNEKFSNVSVSNGKTIDDGARIAVVGYAMPGANEDLGTDILPSSFTVEADTSKFELPVTYSVLLNELFADIDTSRLSDVDSLVASMNELSDGLDQIIAGASELSDGVGTLIEKSEYLSSKVGELSTGLSKLDSSSSSLTDGAASIYEQVVLPTVSARIAANATLYGAIQKYGIDFPLMLENYATSIPAISKILEPAAEAGDAEAIATMKSLAGVQGFYDGLFTYTAGVSEAADGAALLYAGIPALVEGETAIYNGTVTLSEGLSTFKNEGISRLVSFANEDLAGFARNARAMVSAAKSYHAYSRSDATSVKFIVKTASVK